MKKVIFKDICLFAPLSHSIVEQLISYLKCMTCAFIKHKKPSELKAWIFSCFHLTPYYLSTVRKYKSLENESQYRTQFLFEHLS